MSMETKVFWAGDKIQQSFPTLENDVKTDACIIGGGLAGLLCAEALYKSGIQNIAVLEASTIGGGETSKSSAMLSFAHDLVYDRLIKKHGIETARAYYKLNRNGLDTIKQLIKEYKIDCGYNECDMYLYAKTKKGAAEIKKEHAAYQKINVMSDITRNIELPFPVLSALKLSKQGYLNPYQFITSLCNALNIRGVSFYENTFVAGQPKNGTLKVNDFTVSAKHFIYATHYPFINFPGFYFLKMYQGRSYNVVFESEIDIKDIYEGIDEHGFEYRPVGNAEILCGGAAVRTGKNKNKQCFGAVEKNIFNDFNTNKILARFSAQDCMTFDMLPFAGRYSSFLENVYVITGFNKWGFTTSAACAKIIADIISGNLKHNPFDTSRLYTIKSPIKAMRNIGTIAAGWFNTLFSPDTKKIKRIPLGGGAIVKYKGKRCGVYKAKSGQLEFIHAVCPHLGCGLKWNQDDVSWDCPCHGSRFDTKGQIINNPSIKNAEKLR